MVYLIQIYNMVHDKNLFLNMFNDLSFELDELGYRECPSDLISDLLQDHFDLVIENDKQLKQLSDCIIKHQGQLEFLKSL